MNWLLIIFLLFFSVCSNASPATLVIDISNNQIIDKTGEDIQRPIASLTKLMTAIVVLNSEQSLTELVKINRQLGTSLPQKNYSRLELLHAMLVRSDNSAAETLAENYPGGRSAFVRAMNSRAQDLGLYNTRFIDPSGLGVFNVSTLSDISMLLQEANRHELIRSISTLKEIRLPTERKNQFVNLFNTNYAILSQIGDIILSKTGYTIPAGFCLAMILNRSGRDIVVVVLGEKNKQQRFDTVSRIIKTLS